MRKATAKTKQRRNKCGALGKTIMNEPWMKQAACVGLLCLVGCGSQSSGGSSSQAALPAGYVAPASTANLPLVDHPEYAAWSRFPVGAGVVRKKEVTNEFGSVSVTTTVRLHEKSADKVVVQTQITVDRSAEGLVENPPQTAEFPAKFRLPPNMKLEQFALPSLRAKLVGEETRDVAGREFKAEVFTWQEFSERGQMTIKLWRSDEIPGRMLRQDIEGPMHHSVEEVVEIMEGNREQGTGDRE
jgi:hypothetical protein